MAVLPRATLILGGARSGKSRFAEALVSDHAADAVYLATATIGDAEMADRVAHHRAGRDARWTTVEEPLALPERLTALARPERPVLVDCLTFWLFNLMEADRDIEAAAAELVTAIGRLAGPAVFVANEVGLGIVPDNALARRFRDHAGRLNQDVAAAADAVIFLAAGLPLWLKGRP